MNLRNVVIQQKVFEFRSLPHLQTHHSVSYHELQPFWSVDVAQTPYQQQYSDSANTADLSMDGSTSAFGMLPLI